jgi:uncharacterized DUF497 family protein
VAFEWDPAKSETTERRRGIRFERAAEIFAGRIIMWIDSRKDYGEQRIRAVGESGGELSLGAVLSSELFRSAERTERSEPNGTCAHDA